MTNLETFSDLANQPVEGFKPKPTRLTDEQVEALNPLWTSADAGVKIGHDVSFAPRMWGAASI